MDPVSDAPRLLAGLFPDGGRALLGDGGLGASWPEALRHVPARLLAVPAGADAGLRQLLALRDFWWTRGDLRPALAATRGLYQLRVAANGREHADALFELAALGALAERAGRADEGGAMLEQAWAALSGGGDLRVAVVAQNVAGSRMRRGDPQGAEAALETAYRLRKRLAPGTVALAAAQLGEARVQLGRARDAIGLLEEAHALTVKQEGPASPRACARGQLLGAVCNQLERYAQAVKVLRPVHDALQADASDDPALPDRRASVAFELGLALDRTGVREEGLRRIEEALRLTRQLSEGGRPHPELPNRLTMMAQAHLDRGRIEEEEGVLLEALEVEKRLRGDASPEVAARYAALGAFCLRHGRDQEALGWLDAAASLLRSTLGDAHPDTKAAVEQEAALLLRLSEAALARRDRELAADLLKRGTEIAAPVLGFTHEKVRKIRDLGAKHRLA